MFCEQGTELIQKAIQTWEGDEMARRQKHLKVRKTSSTLSVQRSGQAIQILINAMKETPDGDSLLLGLHFQQEQAQQ